MYSLGTVERPEDGLGRQLPRAAGWETQLILPVSQAVLIKSSKYLHQPNIFTLALSLSD